MSGIAPHQAIYRRWRAQTFSQIVGQEAVVETLRNAVRSNHVAHALLFVGPRGTGKTSMARILAKAINCTDLRDGEPCDRCPACVAIREGRAFDVAEMDAASNNKVDDMRELVERTMTAPSDLRRKVYIVDEVQRITQGWDVLLRTLEEPPDHVVFIFCTTDASQIRPAVLSRVQRFDFRRLTVPQIEGKLRMILDAEGRAAESDAVGLVAHLAAGGMRDAESMLDQLLASGADPLTGSQVRELLGLADADTVDAFVDALAAGDAGSGITLLDGLEERGRDVRTFLDQVVDAIRAALVAQLAGQASERRGRHATLALVAAGRRLASIDPTRAGPGGVRFQLELALLAPLEPAPLGTARVGDAALDGHVPAPAGPAVGPSRRSNVSPGQGKTPAGGEAVVAASPPSTPGPDAPMTDGTEDAQPGRPASVPASRAQADGSEAARQASADTAVSTGQDDLDELMRRWPEVVAHVSQHPPTKPLIAACRPIAVEGNVVTLGFPEGQAFLKDVAERRRAILEEGVGRFLGRPVAVRCVATNVELAAPLPADPEGARLLDEFHRIFAGDVADVREVE
ncbi:MAG TPA: DNA polymerase III subunit gamma/tau [Candidatus Limnocylindrales bacterium]